MVNVLCTGDFLPPSLACTLSIPELDFVWTVSHFLNVPVFLPAFAPIILGFREVHSDVHSIHQLFEDSAYSHHLHIKPSGIECNISRPAQVDAIIFIVLATLLGGALASGIIAVVTPLVAAGIIVL